MGEELRTHIAAAVSGDADALSELLRQHGPAVERTLRIDRLWRSVLDPADVMQVTYIEAFREIRRFDANRAEMFEPWLRQIAANNLRDAIRGLARDKRPPPQRRARVGEAAEDREALEIAFGISTTTPSRNARRNERVQRVTAAVAELPPDYAAVVRMYDVEGRPIADVAAATGRSPGAVHMLRARAYDRLRELLGPQSAFFSRGE